MDAQYDEDVQDNPFFRELHENHSEVFKKAIEEGWIICVPCLGTTQRCTISTDDILDHILVPSSELPDTHFCTLTEKQLYVKNRVIIITNENNTSSSVHIFFDVTFYEKNTCRYKVWCIEYPLNQRTFLNDSAIYNPLTTLSDCIDLLWSESLGCDILEQVNSITDNFVQSDFEAETLQVLRDLVSSLYTECLHKSLKKPCLRDKIMKNTYLLENFKQAVETYMHHCIYNKLFNAISNFTSHEDANFNKTVRNLSDLQLKDFNIRSEFYESIPCSKRELSKVNQFSTVLGKTFCLKKAFETISSHADAATKSSCTTADDLLQILVFLVIKTNISNWLANLTFVTKFRFSCVDLSDENSFLITSLEAAIEYIKSGELLVNTAPEYDENNEATSNSLLNSSPCSISYLFSHIQLGNLQEVRNLFKYNKEDSDASLETQLCHPLCSCDGCEKLLGTVESKSSFTAKSCDDKGYTPLLVACIYGQPIIVEYLISIGSSVNASDYSGSSPLHYAALRGHQNVLLLLLHSGANAKASDSDGNTPLHLAVNNGHESCVKGLLYFSEQNFDVDVNCVNNSGDSPLHLAAKWGYTNIVQILLQFGANRDLVNKRNQKAVDIAHNFYISELLAHSRNNKSSVEMSAEKSRNIRREFNSEVPNLLDFGVRPKNLDQLKKTDLLLKAVENNDLPLTCYYLGTPIPQNKYDANPICHPLCTCEKCVPQREEENNQDVLLSLCPTGSTNVNICNSQGYTALHIAAKYGRNEILRLLLDSGASTDLKTYKRNYTALHLACIYQRIQVVRELLKCGGCNIDSQDAKGNTSLYYTSLKSDTRIFELLLSCGADFNVKNNEGRTVWQDTQGKMSFNIMKLLKDKCLKSSDSACLFLSS